MDYYKLLEQLSYIYYNNINNIAKIEAIHGIMMLTDAILVDEKTLINQSFIDNYCISIINKYSDFYIEKRLRNDILQKSAFDFAKTYTIAEKELNSVDAQDLTLIYSVDSGCANKYTNAFNNDTPININVKYDGFDYSIQVPSGVNDSGIFVKNKTIELYSGFKYLFNIDASGHPFIIQTVDTAFDSDKSLSEFSGIPISNGSIQINIPISGIYKNGIKHQQLYYICASGHIPGHAISDDLSLLLKIIGTNDIPIIKQIVDNDQNINEAVDASAQIIKASGRLILNDLDFGDNLTPTITANSTFGSLSNVSNLSIDSIMSNGEDISVDWVYTAPVLDLDFINSRSSINISYKIKFYDENVYSGEKLLNINIIGTNDSPTIVTGGTIAGYVVYDPNISEPLSVSGQFSIFDPDIGDTYSVNIEPLDASFGTLNAGISNSTKVVTWVFDVNSETLNTLTESSVVTQTYLISVKDQDNSIVTQIITITIYGIDAFGALSINNFHALSEYLLYETNSSIVESGIIAPPSGIDITDPINFYIDVFFSGYTSGIPVTSGALIDMLQLNFNSGQNVINWVFDSNGEAFNYLRFNKELYIDYKIKVENTNEGGEIYIRPGFKAKLIDIRPEAILYSGTHDYIDQKYWKSGEDIPLKYGGINDIKAITNYDSDCWDLHNFKYQASGLFGLDRPESNVRLPIHPLSKNYVPEFEYFGEPRYEKTLYSSSLYKLDNRKYQVKIGHSPNDFGVDGEYYGYDSLGDMDPTVYSTKWPAEKVTLSIEKNFKPSGNNVYPTGLDFGIINNLNYRLVDVGDPITYRNISLVDIRTNAYKIQPIASLNRQQGNLYQPTIYFTGPTVNESNTVVEIDQLEAISAGASLYRTFFVNVLVQNREWHRDAGHAYIKHILELEEFRGQTDIIDVIEVGNNISIPFGYIPWSAGSFFDNNSSVKIGGVRGQNTINPCPCGADLDFDGLADPVNCGCTGKEVYFRNEMTFFPGTNIDDLSVGMYVQGPYIPFGTFITAINETETIGQCGPWITLSAQVDDSDPVTGEGAALGECTAYLTYTFSSLNSSVFKRAEIQYPLRSNRGQLYEYGIWYPLEQAFDPVFYSYAYYEDWRNVRIPTGGIPLRGEIRLIQKDALIYPTQIFSEGWAVSRWNRCYRPVSKIAVDPKLGSPNSISNYLYSDNDCKGLYPFYEFNSVDCGPFCPPYLDPCCFQCSSPFPFCRYDDIVDYEGNSFYNYPIETLGTELGESIAGLQYFNTFGSGTGHAGNTLFPAGVVPDPVTRPKIADDQGRFLNILYPYLGYINPSVEVTVNYNNNQRPASLLSYYHPLAASFGAPTSSDPFYVYEPHGFAQFNILMRAKRTIFKQFPLFPRLDDPGRYEPDGSCRNLVVDASIANLKITTELNNLHINVSKNINSTNLDNDVSFNSGILFPPTTGITKITDSLYLYPPTPELIDHDQFWPPFVETVNIKSIINRGQNQVNNLLEDPYCYERPETASSCNSSKISIVTEDIRRRSKKFEPDYLSYLSEKCCTAEQSHYGKNTCECFVSPWDSDQFANRQWNKLGFKLFEPSLYLLYSLNPFSPKHMADNSYKNLLRDWYGYESQASFVLDVNLTHGSPCNKAFSYTAFGALESNNFRSDPGGARPTYNCCDLPVSTGCPILSLDVVTDVPVINEAKAGSSSTTVPFSAVYQNNCGAVLGTVDCSLEWYPVPGPPNTEGQDLYMRATVEYNPPVDFPADYTELLSIYGGNKNLLLDNIYDREGCSCEFLSEDPDPDDGTIYEDWLRVTYCCEETAGNFGSAASVTTEWQLIECDSKSLGASFTFGGDGINGTLTFAGDCLAAFLLELDTCEYGTTTLL